MTQIEKISKEFEKWIGYCEKDSVARLGIDLDRVEPYNKGAGYANNTIFAKVYETMTGIKVQGQPWCDTFIDTIFIHVFGVKEAKRLLGGFSAYTPTSANYFKSLRRYVKSPARSGDIVFFRDSTRICHTGFVVSQSGDTLVTIEGNTSTGSTIIANGGLVAKKVYSVKALGNRLDGFGRPDYLGSVWVNVPNNGNNQSTLKPVENQNQSEWEKTGWKIAADGKRWWWDYGGGRYPKNCFVETDGLRYHMDSGGYMSVGGNIINGKRHYFSENGIVGAELIINSVPKGQIVEVPE